MRHELCDLHHRAGAARDPHGPVRGAWPAADRHTPWARDGRAEHDQLVRRGIIHRVFRDPAVVAQENERLRVREHVPAHIEPRIKVQPEQVRQRRQNVERAAQAVHPLRLHALFIKDKGVAVALEPRVDLVPGKLALLLVQISDASRPSSGAATTQNCV